MTAHVDGNELNEILFQRYCAGTASPDEAAQIERWFQAYPDQRHWYEQFKAEARRQTVPAMSQDDWHSAWVKLVGAAVQRRPDTADKLLPLAATAKQAVSTTALTKVTNTPFGHRRTPISSLRRWMVSTAAALATGIIFAIAAWNAGVHYIGGRAAKAALIYATGNGQRANITLPDGSTVALNVASRLEVPADYITGDHTVRLVGEGFFTVTHHDGTPLTVIAGITAARVLGTSFIVKHYLPDPTATIAVHDGKVAVGTTVLAANQQANVDASGAIQRGPASPSAFSFATGVLSFDGVPLRDAIPMLNRWFDADIRLGDTTLGVQKVVGGFTPGSLSNLTESLTLTFNVRVVRNGRVLTLYRK